MGNTEQAYYRILIYISTKLLEHFSKKDFQYFYISLSMTCYLIQTPVFITADSDTKQIGHVPFEFIILEIQPICNE